MRTAIVLLALSTALFSQPSLAKPADCETGPISKTYGGSEWLVYGCHGNLRLFSAPDSKAGSAMILVEWKSARQHYELSGLAAINRDQVKLALDDLRQLSESDVRALLEEVVQSGTK